MVLDSIYLWLGIGFTVYVSFHCNCIWNSGLIMAKLRKGLPCLLTLPLIIYLIFGCLLIVIPILVFSYVLSALKHNHSLIQRPKVWLVAQRQICTTFQLSWLRIKNTEYMSYVIIMANQYGKCEIKYGYGTGDHEVRLYYGDYLNGSMRISTW